VGEYIQRRKREKIGRRRWYNSRRAYREEKIIIVEEREKR
jgi:hypothetical protein